MCDFLRLFLELEKNLFNRIIGVKRSAKIENNESPVSPINTTFKS